MLTKKHYLVIALLIVVALLSSLMLVPGAREIALMQMKDKHFAEARIAYEIELARGNLTLDVVSHLTDLYLQVGAIDKAITTMEKFVTANPNNLEARQKLGLLYQYAQRPDDYLHNLEAINRIKVRPENLIALSSIYNYSGHYDKEAGALKQLITVDQNKNPKYYKDLANIQASRHDYAGAIATLHEMEKVLPAQFTFENNTLLISLLLDSKQPDEAAKVAASWVDKHNDAAQGAELVNLLHFQGSNAMADALLAHYSESQINSSAALLDAFVLLQLSEGKEDVAFQRLKSLHDQNKLLPAMNGRLLFLAVSHGDKELTHQLLKGTDLTTLSETQLVALVVLAVSESDKPLLEDVTSSFPESTTAKSYPVLTAALSVANHRPDANAALAKLDSVQLETEPTLQIANICAHSERYECANHFLDKMPAMDKLSDADIANIGDLYFIMSAWDKGSSYLKQALQTRNSLLIQSVALQFSAAMGDDKAVHDWMVAHPDELNPRMLSDLYFSALNNKHLGTAQAIAEIFHDKFNSPLSRSLLANAYIKNGKYEQALTLLRENSPKSEDDENNYLTALVKLAPRNQQYRNELRTYAAEKLHSGVSGKQKLALVYGLVDAGQVDIAMPYIRELALKSGGQWAALYASLLDKEGKYEEARKFWLQVADQPYTTAKEKKSIAFDLLDHGYKADAERLFKEVAANEGPQSEDVKDLLFLMGPNPTQEDMEWMEGRYTQSTAPDQAQWATVVDEYVSPDYLAGFVKRHPEVMNDPKITNDYFQVMLNKGKLASMEKGYIDYTKQYGNTAVLRQYADVADSGGLKRQARDSYEVIASIDPADYVAVRQSGVLAYEQADYRTSNHYLGEYIKYYQTHPITDPNAYLVYFYYGEVVRHANPEKSRPYYRTALQLMQNRTLATPEAQSVKAQSQIWSGDAKGGFATFDAAIASYPDSRELRADKISALVDLERYDEARKVLAATPASGAATPAGVLSLPVFSEHIKDYTLLENNTKLLIRFTGPVNENVAADLNKASWVSYTSEGYDTLLIATKTGYAFKVAANAPKTTMNAADNEVSTIQIVADNHQQGAPEDPQIKLRYALLQARIDLETGHVYNAAKLLNSLLPQYKNDPQLLGFTANAENYGGNWPRAEQLLKEAHALAPENQDILALERDARREHAQNVTLDYEWVDYAKSLENITTLKGYVDATDHVIVGASLQDNYEQGKNLRLSNGQVGDANGNREIGELYALYHGENGLRVQGSLFGNNNTAGVGGYVNFLNPLGETALTAEFHAPYWDLPEAVLDDADRDRLAFLHTIKPTTRLTIDGGLGLNRYNVKDIDDVASSVTTQLDVVYRIQEGQERVRPFIDLGYGMEGEYVETGKTSLDSTGDVTRVLPLVSREIHTIFADTGYAFSDKTYGDVLVGYEYDRLGGNGPLIEGKINHEFTQSFDAQLRASYGLDTTSTENTITRIGAYIRWRF